MRAGDSKREDFDYSLKEREAQVNAVTWSPWRVNNRTTERPANSLVQALFRQL